jgi:hypothetical protein
MGATGLGTIPMRNGCLEKCAQPRSQCLAKICGHRFPYRGYQLDEITMVPRPGHLPVEI